MSLVPTPHLPAVVAGILGLALIGGGLAVAVQPDSGADPSAIKLRTPSKAVDVIASHSPADAAIAASSRLYAASPAVVVVEGGRDDDAEEVGIATATALSVPVLVDGPATPAEVKRLGATTVLTVGDTQPYPGDRRVLDVGKEIKRVKDAYDIEEVGERGVIVLTRSKKTDTAAIATAQNAGAQVLELPGGDPRTDSLAAKILEVESKAPVIAIGKPFTSDLEYTVSSVRSGKQQLGGGYLAFPGRTMVALYGHPTTDALGVLGEQGVSKSIKRAKLLAKKYRRVVKTPVVPTFEIIATVASAGAGKDKNYSRETRIRELLPLIDAAEKAGVYVIIDLQPGRTDFLKQAKRYESLLKRPHVGLALDPEWRLRSHQKHLTQIGKVSVHEVNRVGRWLAALTRAHDLPQKVFVLHQFNITMIKGRSKLNTKRPELATVIHVDGQGGQPDKRATWQYLRKGAPRGVFWGWKNFEDEDKPMLTVKQTWKRVKPHPQLISYQ